MTAWLIRRVTMEWNDELWLVPRLRERGNWSDGKGRDFVKRDRNR